MFPKADTLVIDKTGTLIEGKSNVVAVRGAPDVSEAELLHLAASVERASEHPLAAAIVSAASERGLTLAEPEGVDSPVGKGVLGQAASSVSVIGNALRLRTVKLEG